MSLTIEPDELVLEGVRLQQATLLPFSGLLWALFCVGCVLRYKNWPEGQSFMLGRPSPAAHASRSRYGPYTLNMPGYFSPALSLSGTPD